MGKETLDFGCVNYGKIVVSYVGSVNKVIVNLNIYHRQVFLNQSNIIDVNLAVSVSVSDSVFAAERLEIGFKPRTSLTVPILEVIKVLLICRKRLFGNVDPPL